MGRFLGCFQLILRVSVAVGSVGGRTFRVRFALDTSDRRKLPKRKPFFLSFCNLNIHTYVYQYFTFAREGREIFAVFIWKSGKFAIFVVQVIRYR